MSKIVVSEERGVRYLHFGSPWIQGAMRIARPDALEFEYTRELMFPLLLHDDRWPAKALQVGLGAGSVTRFLHRHRPQCHLTVVEIDADVVAAARQFFPLPEPSPRLRIVVDDGNDFLAATRSRYDFIIVDGFDAKGRPGMLDTATFYANCCAHLSRHGALAINLLSRTRGVDASAARLAEAFGDSVLVLPASEPGNVVAFAGAPFPLAESAAELRDAAWHLKAQTGLDLRPTLTRLARARTLE